MKPTDFAVHVPTFLTHDLAAQRHLSPHTSKASRDVLTLWLRFCRDVRGLAPERLRLDQIDVAWVEAFLESLERARRAAPTPRNHRLAALHAFCRDVQSAEPDRLLQGQHILAIPPRRHARPTVGDLSTEDLAAILAQPDLSTREGRRDAVLLSVLYDTGARVQEVIDLSAGDLRLEPPAQVRLLGKGRKMRAVPVWAQTVPLLRAHLHEHHLDRPAQGERPVCQNEQHQRFSRSGLRYILQKDVEQARSQRPSLPPTVTPHTLRHPKGMHLLQRGLSLEMMRDFFGHVDVKTTPIYASAHLEMKRNALESLGDSPPLPTIPSWQQNKNLLEWLRSLERFGGHR